jgi:hypothetical protein
MSDTGAPQPPQPPLSPFAYPQPTWRPEPAAVAAPGRGAPPAGPAHPGPTTSLPRHPVHPYGPAAHPSRPPGPFGTAVQEFWSEARVVPTRVLLVCCVVGVVGGVSLVGHRPGLGAAIVGLGVWAGAVPALVRRRQVPAGATAALSVALVAVVAVRDAGWLVALCVGTAAVLAAVAATGARATSAVLFAVPGWFAGMLRAMGAAGRSVRLAVGGRSVRLLGVVRSVAVTVVLLTAFGLLFASADQVFASYLPDVQVDLLPWQVVVGLLVALVSVTLAFLAAAPSAWADVPRGPDRPAPFGEWLTPVVALDMLVLGFVLVQVGALVGGHRYVEQAVDLTYAEYARQGFGQLVAATALTLAVVAVAARKAPRATSRERLAVRVALGALCVATIGVVASALRRMDLYVEAFGLTRLRLFVVVVEVVLGVVLVLVLAAGVRRRGTWLPRAVVQVAGIAMVALAVANPDALILEHNTTVLLHPDADADGGAGPDLDYLMGLSADAVPGADRLAEPLRSCVLRAIEVDASGGLLDWNLGRAEAASALADGAPVEDVGSRCLDEQRREGG